MGKRTIIWCATIAIALVGGVVVATALSGGPTPREQRADGIPQTASDTDEGVTIRAVGATFSGTETLVEMRAEPTGPGIRDRVGFDFTFVSPAHDAIDGPFAGSDGETIRSSNGGVLLRLPPLAVGPDYDGSVELTVAALEFIAGEPSPAYFRLDGSWVLTLEGPEPAALADTLRVEELEAVVLPVADHAIRVAGIRSRSETIVMITAPPELRFLVPVTIETANEALAPYAQRELSDGIRASFPTTPFGEAVTIELGAIAVIEEGEDTVFTVDLGRALGRVGGGPAAHGLFALSADDVIEGDPHNVIDVERGSHVPRREWVGVRFVGNWHLEDGLPLVFGESGEEFSVSGATTSYGRESTGRVGGGTTQTRVFVDDPGDLGLVTFVLGANTSVLRDEYRVRLEP